MYLVIAGTISARSAANRSRCASPTAPAMRNPPNTIASTKGTRDNCDDFPPDRPIAQRPRRGPFRRCGFGAVVLCGPILAGEIAPRGAGKHGHRTSAVLASAPLNRSVSASFMRLPANCARPERRASDIRLAIGRVCQAAAAVTTILTEQTEFTDALATRLLCHEQTGKRAHRPPHWAGPLKIVAQGGQLGSRGFGPCSTCMCGPGREILVGPVIVVAATVVPISHTISGHRLARTPAGRILTAARRVCV